LSGTIADSWARRNWRRCSSSMASTQSSG